MGEEAVTRHFATAGEGSPVAVVATASAAGPVRAAVAGTAGIGQVGDPTVHGICEEDT